MLRNRSISLGLWSALWLSALTNGVAPAADHRDAPNLTFEVGGAGIRALDINDVYIFQSPSNSLNTVMMMTVNPLIVGNDPVFFSSTGSYEFKIDNGGNVNPEITFSCSFTAPRAGRQEIRVTRINHGQNGARDKSELIARGQTGSNIAIRGAGQLRADLFDDPFFFDLHAFKGDDGRVFNDVNHNDFFKGFNTDIIVLELPSATLTGVAPNNMISVWCRTLNAAGAQIDRMGRPAIATALVRPNKFIGAAPALIPPETRTLKQQFNETLPINDVAMWNTEVRRALGLFHPPAIPGAPTPAETAALDGLAAVLLPDVLTFQCGNPAGFLNGRQLANDVIDAELNLLTGGALTTDSEPVNDKVFRLRFPYAATPHTVP